MGNKVHARSKFKNSQMTLCGSHFENSIVTFNISDVTCKRCVYELLKDGNEINGVKAWEPGMKKKHEQKIFPGNI